MVPGGRFREIYYWDSYFTLLGLASSGRWQQVRDMVAADPLGAEVRMHIGGQGEELDASISSLIFALSLAIFLVYLVMASQFESLLHPFVILFTIPLALVGAILALMLTGKVLEDREPGVVGHLKAAVKRLGDHQPRQPRQRFGRQRIERDDGLAITRALADHAGPGGIVQLGVVVGVLGHGGLSSGV